MVSELHPLGFFLPEQTKLLMLAERSERKRIENIFPMKLLNFLHSSIELIVQSAQLLQLCSMLQARILHHSALLFALHPGHSPFTNLRQAPQYSPQAATYSALGRYVKFSIYTMTDKMII